MSLNGILQDLGVVGGSGGSDTTKPTTLSLVAGEALTGGRAVKIGSDLKAYPYDKDLDPTVAYNSLTINTASHQGTTTYGIYPLFDLPNHFIIIGTNQTTTTQYCVRIVEVGTDGSTTVRYSSQFTSPTSEPISGLTVSPMGYVAAGESYYGLIIRMGGGGGTGLTYIRAYYVALKVVHATYAVTQNYTVSLYSQSNPTWSTAGNYYNCSIVRSFGGQGGCSFIIYTFYQYWDGASFAAAQGVTTTHWRGTSNGTSNPSYFGQASAIGASDFSPPTGLSAHPSNASIVHYPGSASIYMIGAHTTGSYAFCLCGTAFDSITILSTSLTGTTSDIGQPALYKFGDSITATGNLYYLFLWRKVSTNETWGRVIKVASGGNSVESLGTPVMLLANSYPVQPEGSSYRRSAASNTSIVVPLYHTIGQTQYMLAKISRPTELTLALDGVEVTTNLESGYVWGYNAVAVDSTQAYAINFAENTATRTIYGAKSKTLSTVHSGFGTYVISPKIQGYLKTSAAQNAVVPILILEKNKEYEASGLSAGKRYTLTSTGIFTESTTGAFLATSSTKLISLT